LITMNYSNPSKLQAAILDWAGTVVDFGSFAPTQIFVEAFAEFDVQVSIEEARGPMGMGKWDHIRTLCDQPESPSATARCLAARPPTMTSPPSTNASCRCRSKRSPSTRR
jgi:phosphonoacetaldehyde hydrolase